MDQSISVATNSESEVPTSQSDENQPKLRDASLICDELADAVEKRRATCDEADYGALLQCLTAEACVAILNMSGALVAPRCGYDLEQALRLAETKSRLRPGQERAGTIWTEEEEQRLVTMFDSGSLIGEMARELKRSIAGVTARLVKLGKVSEEEAPNLRFAFR